MLAAGHHVFYDLSYLGSTSPVVFDLSHERIAFAAVSFSKPYGLFYYRIGFTFAREPIPALVANKWFKNVFGLLLADRLVQELDGPAHAARYKAIQATIVDRIEREHAIGLEPSDAFLIAHVPARRMADLDPSRRALLARFERARGCRLCLTPSFLAHETRPDTPAASAAGRVRQARDARAGSWCRSPIRPSSRARTGRVPAARCIPAASRQQATLSPSPSPEPANAISDRDSIAPPW